MEYSHRIQRAEGTRRKPISGVLSPVFDSTSKEACVSHQSPQQSLVQKIYSVPRKIYLFLEQMTESINI